MFHPSAKTQKSWHIIPNENYYLFELALKKFYRIPFIRVTETLIIQREDNSQKFIKAVKALYKIFKISSRRYFCHMSRITKFIRELAPKNNIYKDGIVLQCELEILGDHCENFTKYDEIMKVSEKLKNVLPVVNDILCDYISCRVNHE